MREAASRGFWVSSHAPYGYNRVMVQDGPKKRPTLEINSDASPIVKRMFYMAEAGNGTLEIIRTLNNEGIASPRGKLWARTSVHNILTNEVYTGFLNESELTERRAFIQSFVKEIIVVPGDALLRYTVPMPDDSLIPGRSAEKVALNGSVLPTLPDGGPTRTVLPPIIAATSL